MSTTEVRIEAWLKQGFDLYKENAVTLILATLFAAVVSIATLGILSGPMLAGLAMIALRLYDGETPSPDAGDVFKGFEVFLSAFLFGLVWGLIVAAANVILGGILPGGIGSFAGLVVSLAVTTGVMFGIFLIVEKRMEFWPASMASFEKVKSNFFPFVAFYIAVGFLGSIGAILCGIGVVITFPFMLCSLTVAYREVFGGGSKASQALEAPPAPPPADAGGGGAGGSNDQQQGGA